MTDAYDELAYRLRNNMGIGMTVDEVMSEVKRFTLPLPTDKDGEVIHVGDTLYGEDRRAWLIKRIGQYGLYGTYELIGRHENEEKPLKAKWMTHIPPDTRENILKEINPVPGIYLTFDKTIIDRIDALVREGRWLND